MKKNFFKNNFKISSENNILFKFKIDVLEQNIFIKIIYTANRHIVSEYMETIFLIVTVSIKFSFNFIDICTLISKFMHVQSFNNNNSNNNNK